MRNDWAAMWATIVVGGCLLGCQASHGLIADRDAGSPSPDASDAGDDAPVIAVDGAAGAGGPGEVGDVGPSAAGAAGGSGGNAGGAGGDGSGGQICGVTRFDTTPSAIDLLVVLDHSASMQDDSAEMTPTGPTDPSKWDQVVPALTDFIASSGASYFWGMKAFPEAGPECSNETVTDRIDVPFAPNNAATMNAAIAALHPDGNGTPTAAAMGVATSYLRTLTDPDRRKYLLLVTDGEPGCAGLAGNITPSGLQAATTDAIAAVTAAASAGYHTFVVGVATLRASTTAVLNSLALAGLEPRTDPRPGARRFYLATTEGELADALRTITGTVISCRFALPPAPGDRDAVAVTVSLNGATVPRDPSSTDGWSYAGATGPDIELFGSWCDQIKTTPAVNVTVSYGCPVARDGGGDDATGG